MEECYRHNGWYPYPLFDLLGTGQRVVLFAGAAAIMTGSTMMLKLLCGKINGLKGAEKSARPGNIEGKKRL